LFDQRSHHPQSVGDLIGRAFRIYRAQIPTFVHILLWPTVFVTAGKVALQWGAASLLPTNMKNLSMLVPGLVAIGIGLLVWMIGLWILTLRQMAAVRLVNGFDTSYEDAHKYIKKHAWSILGLVTLGNVLFGGVALLWIVEIIISAVCIKQGAPLLLYGGIFGVVVGIAGILISLICFLLIACMVLTIAACEEQPLSALVSRGFSLTVKDFGRSLLFGVLLLATLSLLSYPLSLPLVALSVFEFFRHNMSTETLTDPAKMPLYVLVATQVWESLVNMMLWPITFISYGLFYYDLRMRQEGLDVLKNLESLPLLERHST